MERPTRVHARNLVAWARDRPEVLVLSADLTGSTECDLFRDAYPDRFLSLGIAEQNMLSFAGGLAREGFTPFVHTFAVFITRRAYDQVAMSVAYPNLPVRMFGFLPGITTPGGATHQAIEDVALMRSLPNLTVIECADATDVESVLDAAQPVRGPVYVRMLRGEVPRLFPAAEPLRLGRARRLSSGTDLAVFSSGICTEEVLRAQSALRGAGVTLTHLSVSTLKPFDDPAVLEAAERARYGVITVENHSVLGGLGTAVSDLLAEAGLGRKLLKLGLQDTFAHGASRAYLMQEHGFDALGFIKACERMIGAPLPVTPEDLDQVELTEATHLANPEAL